MYYKQCLQWSQTSLLSMPTMWSYSELGTFQRDKGDAVPALSCNRVRPWASDQLPSWGTFPTIVIFLVSAFRDTEVSSILSRGATAVNVTCIRFSLSTFMSELVLVSGVHTVFHRWGSKLRGIPYATLAELVVHSTCHDIQMNAEV